MPLAIGIGIGLTLEAGVGATGPTTQVFSAMSVAADGWTLNAKISASKIGGAYANLNNAAAPGLALVVRSTSWTTGGVQTTIDRTVYATAVQRKAYNQQTARQETTSGSDFTVIFALSSKVYQSDTIVSCAVATGFFTDNGSGGSSSVSVAQTPAVTNNSTLAYPAPIAMWLNPDRDWAQSSSYSVGLTVAHRFFRSGQTVRAVKFIATDQHSNTASVIVTTMSLIAFTGSGLNGSEFRGAIDISGLTQGDLLTIDCIIYPWVGSAWQASVDGATYPSPNMTTLRVLNDRTGAFGTSYGYLDPVSGNDGTAIISTNATLAAALPFLTPGAFATAMKSFNNSNFGRNNGSGGYLRLVAGTTTHASLGTLSGGVIPLIIEAANPALVATTILQDSGSNVFNGFPAYTRIRNITPRKNGAGSVVFISTGGTASSANNLTMENCIFDLNGTTDYAGWILDVGQVQMINCSGNIVNGTSAAIAGNSKQINAWGCDTVAANNCVYNHCGNKSQNAVWSAGLSLSDFQPPTSVMCAFSFLGEDSGGNLVANRDGLSVALMGNIFEQRGTATQPLLELNDSGQTTTTQMLDIANTGVGGRLNAIYNDGSSASLIAGDGINALSVWDELNAKADVFASNGACVGNWAYRYRVDGFYRVDTYGDSNDTAPSPSSWEAELSARGDLFGTNGSPIVVSWTNDQSARGGNAGGGNYKPVAASTALPKIPAGLTAFPYDMNGTAVPTNGNAYVGALQA